MTVHRGRIVRNGQPMTELDLAHGQNELATPDATQLVPRGQVVRRERVQGAEQAEQLVSEARARAEEVLREARKRSESVRAAAEREGMETGAAKLAAAWLRVQQRESEADAAALDRSVAIGRLIAERLINKALELDPDLIADIAREAMHHLWRSKKVTVFAHPEDVEALNRHVATFGMPPERISVEVDGSRARGSLRFTSEFGELDGALAPQLDRLEQAIRQELEAG